MKKYSAKANAFYETDINASIPEDAIEITDKTWNAMLLGQSQGQLIAPGKGGKPVLVERVLTDEEKTLQAESLKRELRAKADEAIAPLQDAVEEGMATDAEASSLSAWKQYRILLNRVITSVSDGAEINWPQIPA